MAAATGQTSYFFSWTYIPPNSQLKNPPPLMYSQVPDIAGPLSANDSGAVIQCTITSSGTSQHTAILTVLGKTLVFQVLYMVTYCCTTHFVTVFPPSPVLISSPNNSLYNFQGDSASFTCAYNVAVGITLSWYMNGALLTSTSHLQISGSSLSISALYANDSGMYQCSVSNGTNSVWGQWAVNVRVPRKWNGKGLHLKLTIASCPQA